MRSHNITEASIGTTRILVATPVGPQRDVEHDDLLPPNWHAGLIPPPDNFPDECSLRLTGAEAEYLSERIRLSPRCAGSLLAELVARRHHCEDVAFVWEDPYSAGLPLKLREMLSHAQNFSELMLGASLLYNLILAEQARWEEGVGDYRQRFSAWGQLLRSRSSVFTEWKRERFWELARAGNPRISRPAQDFINDWWNIALVTTPPKLRDNPEVRGLIRDRERRLKKNLARIDNPRAQELWNGASGSAQLDFRWVISQRLLADIFQGLEAADA